MSTQGFVLGMNEISTLNAARGAAVRVRSGSVWLTQRNDPKYHILKTGDAMPLHGAGATIVTAYEPTLLELYRQDPVAVRVEISRLAHHARNEGIRAFFARFFR